jgi:hypothetical protein
MGSFAVDGKEIVVRIIKYLIEGLVISCAAFLIPKSKPSVEEVLTIGLIAAATFSILDLFAPSFSAPARFGAGLGIGSHLVGGF